MPWEERFLTPLSSDFSCRKEPIRSIDADGPILPAMPGGHRSRDREEKRGQEPLLKVPQGKSSQEQLVCPGKNGS